MNNLRSIPRIIHVQDRDINYYVENNNTQYKNKYKNTYSYKQNDKKNNDNYETIKWKFCFFNFIFYRRILINFSIRRLN